MTNFSHTWGLVGLEFSIPSPGAGPSCHLLTSAPGDSMQVDQGSHLGKLSSGVSGKEGGARCLDDRLLSAERNVPALCPWVPAISWLSLELGSFHRHFLPIQINVQVNTWVGTGAMESDDKFQDKDKEGTAVRSGGECPGVEQIHVMQESLRRHNPASGLVLSFHFTISETKTGTVSTSWASQG